MEKFISKFVVVIILEVMKKIIFFLFLIPINFFAQIDNGLVAHFPFNSDFSDLSPFMSTITNNNAIFGADRNGVANDAIHFDGIGYVSINGNAIKQQFPITVSYWVKLNSLAEVNTFFKTDNVYNNHYGIWMNNLTTGGVSLSFGAGLGTSSSTNQRYYTTNATLPTNVINANNWHHIVGIIRNYNDMDIYIDCRQTTGSYGGTGSTSIAYSANGDSRIGGSIGGTAHPGDFYMDGAIDQFAFWNRELTVEEINFLCDTYNTLSTMDINIENEPKKLIKIIDLLGREIQKLEANETYIYVYSNGSIEKIMKVNE